MLSIRIDYWRLTRNDELASLYGQNRRRLSLALEFYKRIRHEDITEDVIVEALKHIGELRSISDKIEQRRTRLRRLDDLKQKAQDDLRWLTHRWQRLEARVDILREILSQIRTSG